MALTRRQPPRQRQCRALPPCRAGNDKSFRLFLFTDAGNIWGPKDKISADSIRASAGVGISWISPMGPLRLSYGTPVRKQPGDRIERFQFQSRDCILMISKICESRLPSLQP